MANDYEYTPKYISCPFCGYLIPAADVSTTNIYVCPECHRPLPAGVTSLSTSQSATTKG